MAVKLSAGVNAQAFDADGVLVMHRMDLVPLLAVVTSCVQLLPPVFAKVQPEGGKLPSKFSLRSVCDLAVFKTKKRNKNVNNLYPLQFFIAGFCTTNIR